MCINPIQSLNPYVSTDASNAFVRMSCGCVYHLSTHHSLSSSQYSSAQSPSSSFQSSLPSSLFSYPSHQLAIVTGGSHSLHLALIYIALSLPTSPVWCPCGTTSSLLLQSSSAQMIVRISIGEDERERGDKSSISPPVLMPCWGLRLTTSGLFGG